MKISKAIFALIKILIIVISIGYIVLKIYSEKQDGVIFYKVAEFTLLGGFYLFVTLILVFVNWYLEAIKFKLLVSNIQFLSIKKSIKAVLTGITVSIFTPKRIGDFGGRILFLEKKNRVSGVFSTLLGSMSQLIIRLLVGGVLFPIYLSFGNVFDKYNINISFIFSIAIVFTVIVLLVYLNISKVISILGRVSFLKKHSSFFQFIEEYSTKELLIILTVSFARYIVFTFQFVLLLWLFGVNLTYGYAIVGISQVYFFMLLIPTFALGELGVRGSLAVWVFGIITVSVSGVVAASMLLWLLNLAIPAIIGSFYLSKVKY